MPISDYLLSLIKPLVSHPDTVKVNESQDQMGILLSVDVHKDDMGVLIGKAGETAKAIRLLVRIVGLKANARVSIKINEPPGSDYKRKN